MKYLFWSLTASFVLALTACNGTSEKNASTESSAASDQGTFSELFLHYQHLTAVLSSDDDKEAANAANGMLEALLNVNTESFSAEQKSTFDDIAADIQKHSEHIHDNIGNIANQREHLADLSEDFYDIAKEFGTEKPVYKIFCSMYDDNKGAYWLSDSKEVKNPYYGEQMLTCGEVQEELM